MIRRPPRSTRTDTLFPYTTLFRSLSVRSAPMRPQQINDRSLMSTNDNTITELGRGAYWQDLHVGQRFRTLRRTITETDLINFISTTCMLESIFIAAEFEGAAIDGRRSEERLVGKECVSSCRSLLLTETKKHTTYYKL